MTPQQKQRAQAAIGTWHSSNDDSLREYQSAELMAALLQELIDAPEPEPVADGHVYVHVSGLTGSGKSAVAGEIEIAMRAIGLDVEWVGSESEKRLTHADYTSALELYRPKVRIFEKNISRTAPPAPSVPELEEYDAGALNDFGGGNVGWWQDYIRSELGRAYEFYCGQLSAAPTPADRQPPKLSDERIMDIYAELVADVAKGGSMFNFARAIEREILGGEVEGHDN